MLVQRRVNALPRDPEENTYYFVLNDDRKSASFYVWDKGVWVCLSTEIDAKKLTEITWIK